VSTCLGRAHYERSPSARGGRNGVRSRRVQTGEGELVVEVPQVRGTVERFVCRTIPGTRTVVRTRPLEALIIGAYVRGLSDRDLESLLAEAGLGQLSRSSASRVCQELRERYRAFCARSLAGIELLALFLDAVYLPTRPSGAKEGVLVAWGYDLDGKRQLLAVGLGQRERTEDWRELGRDLVRRGLLPPWLAVTDGAPGLVRAVEELWPEADRRRLPVGGPARPLRPPALPAPPAPAAAFDESARALSGRGATPRAGHRPLPRREQLPQPLLGGA